MFTLLLSLSLSADPILVEKPDAFATLVNPNCSHCVDEAKRRKDELKADDPVLCWTRGYSDGGAIPIRFFLNTYRVISDSYGVFVYDPDAGYARGYAPSYNFVFHGWRNGIMVMKDKSDGTLYSCLSGEAFAGPRKGHRLTPIPTVMSTWGRVMEQNPNAVAYHMFEKYKPSDLPTTVNENSLRTQLAKVDPRLKPDHMVLGVRVGNKTRAYPIYHSDGSVSAKRELNGVSFVVFSEYPIISQAAYKLIASQPRKWKGPNPDKNGVSPADAGKPLPDDKELPVRTIDEIRNYLTGPSGGGGDNWRIDGRPMAGEIKGWTLEPVESVVCKWFAWSAEYPETEVNGQENLPAGKGRQSSDSQAVVEKPTTGTAEAKVKGQTTDIPRSPNDAVKQVAGTAEFLRLLPKKFAAIQSIDIKVQSVTLKFDGDKLDRSWKLEPDAEIHVHGFWGLLEQFKVGDRVWVWLKLDRRKNPVSIALLADELSEQVIHDQPWKVIEKKETPTGAMHPSNDYRMVVERNDLKEEFKWRGLSDIESVKSVYLYHEDNELKWMNVKWFEEWYQKQKQFLRKHWRDEGLPGTIGFHHVFSGEMDVILDHEAMRWGRSLQYGDKVELIAEPPITAIVKSVSPWRERTQLRLVVGELQSSELKSGQRIHVKMPWPAKEIDDSPYPTDIERTRTKAERVEWFLASMYCVCGVGKDICTGDFYTLASCNPNGCGAPNGARKDIGKMIDAGMTDKQIWDDLVKTSGPEMTRPHLRK